LYNGYKLIYNTELTLNGDSCDVRSAKPGSDPFTSTITSLPSDINYNNMYLFKIEDDPYEMNDLLEGDGADSHKYSDYETIINTMFEIIATEKEKGFMSQQHSAEEDDADASNFNGAWEPFQDEDADEFTTTTKLTKPQKLGQI